jgi:hypothetical protein
VIKGSLSKREGRGKRVKLRKDVSPGRIKVRELMQKFTEAVRAGVNFYRTFQERDQNGTRFKSRGGCCLSTRRDQGKAHRPEWLNLSISQAAKLRTRQAQDDIWKMENELEAKNRG